MDYQESIRIAEALERIAEMMAHPLQAVQCSKETTTPKRVRNEAAVCGNCPYYARHPYSADLAVCGIDSKTMHYGLKINADGFCGSHPGFWKEGA